MEIALIHNNQLLLGPMGFNMRMINLELEELEINDVVTPQSFSQLPIHFSDGLTHLLPIERNYPNIDSKYYNIGEFIWEIVQEYGLPSKVLFVYPSVEKTIEEVKEERKKEVTFIRKQNENSIITLTVNNTLIEVVTTREERQLLSSKLSATPNLCNYKFQNSWLEISTQELQYIINQIDNYVQSQFDWEYTKHNEIENCLTIDDVYNVEISNL